MSDLISRQAAIDVLKALEKPAPTARHLSAIFDCEDAIKSLPSAEPEIIPIEEVSNQLGCATIQSALYWFEFLKTLDSLGFAIVRKKTR